MDQTVVNQIYSDLSSVLYTQRDQDILLMILIISYNLLNVMIYRIRSNYSVLQILPSYLRVRFIVLRIIRKHAKG